ncbi:MAG: thioredoxin domain-containing protein [Saprospiraceae bacterium]|nr:thioredoxin domain-containing protein [Saprospiraceae bacterium]
MFRPLFPALLLLFAQCAAPSSPATGLLTAADFSRQLQATPGAQLIDVRTPTEFAKGHLANAVNIDWNSAGFAGQAEKLDHDKPVFVYCLSGGRSGEAAGWLRSAGFSKVYDLEGGILKWRAAKLPETKDDPAKTAGMSKGDYDALLKSDKLVLVDFYADWCGPCRKMAPYLEEIKTEMADRVTVVRINADDNQDLMKTMGNDALPVLLIYKNGAQLWRNEGFIDKAGVVAQLNAARMTE